MMDRMLIDTFRTMICEELEDIAKAGLKTHDILDMMKDLLQSWHYLDEIEERTKHEDMKYSQRSAGRYYVDGNYMGGYGSFDGGNSYARGQMRNSYEGNSMYYSPRMGHPMYSMQDGNGRIGDRKEVIEELRKMMDNVKDDAVKLTISEAIGKLDK